jgi:EpsI family protein
MTRREANQCDGTHPGPAWRRGARRAGWVAGAGGWIAPRAVVLVLLAVMTVLTVTMREPVPEPDAGAAPALPDRVGDYAGRTPMFCQNEQCPLSLKADASDASAVCPECGGARLPVSLAERRSLPEGTRIVRTRYAREGAPAITASIVTAEREQRSIHRPQQCLPAQGYVIEDSRVMTVAMAGRRPLKIMVLDLRRAGAGGAEQRSTYAYWFVGGGRETPYHLVRLFWTAWDRIVHAVSPRWAYLTVATHRRGEADDPVARVTRFVAELSEGAMQPIPVPD